MQPLSSVEYGGMLSDRVLVPHAEAMLARLPGNADPVALASVSDNLADGFRSVAPHLRDQPRADVLIVCHGARSIALYAALAAIALGAGSVTFESDDETALAVAAALGATSTQSDFGRRASRWPIVVDCGTRPEVFLHALDSTESEGVLHSVSYYAEPFTSMPLGKLYTRGIRFFTGRVHSAATLRQVMPMIADGALLPALVTPTVIDWDDAPSHYLDPAIKLVVTRT